jgi:hypothetical protein
MILGPIDDMGRTIPIPPMPKRPPSPKSRMDYWDLEKLFPKITEPEVTEYHWQAVSEFQLLTRMQRNRPSWIWRFLYLIRKIFVHKPKVEA